jgi:hypothetical protein
MLCRPDHRKVALAKATDFDQKQLGRTGRFGMFSKKPWFSTVAISPSVAGKRIYRLEVNFPSSCIVVLVPAAAEMTRLKQGL